MWQCLRGGLAGHGQTGVTDLWGLTPVIYEAVAGPHEERVICFIHFSCLDVSMKHGF